MILTPLTAARPPGVQDLRVVQIGTLCKTEHRSPTVKFLVVSARRIPPLLLYTLSDALPNPDMRISCVYRAEGKGAVPRRTLGASGEGGALYFLHSRLGPAISYSDHWRHARRKIAAQVDCTSDM